MTTVFGLFTNFEQAQAAIHDLLRVGIDRSAIGLLSSERPSEHLKERELYGEQAIDEQGAPLQAGVLNSLMGPRVVVVPEIGSFLVAGPLASALANSNTEVARERIAASLSGFDLSHDEAHSYGVGVMRGHTLLSVRIAEHERDSVLRLLEQAGALDLQQIVGEQQGDADPGKAWKESRKIGTVGGTLAGAATGAAVGSLGGPIGSLIGGVAGAISGAAVGAAGDTLGETVMEQEEGTMGGMDTRDLQSDRQKPASSETGSAEEPLYNSEEELHDQSFYEQSSHGYRVEDERSWALHEAEYRDDFEQKYREDGLDWDQYAIAYRYGHMLASLPRYQQGSWEELEPDMQQRWDESISGAWESVRDAVRFAWERAKQMPRS